MSAVKPPASIISSVNSVGWRSPARVEKAHHSNALDGERRGAQQDDNFTSAKLARVHMSRNETRDVEPDREDQRLVPAFVTQFLAQVMKDAGRPPAAAASAYRNRVAQVALIYDRDT